MIDRLKKSDAVSRNKTPVLPCFASALAPPPQHFLRKCSYTLNLASFFCFFGYLGKARLLFSPASKPWSVVRFRGRLGSQEFTKHQVTFLPFPQNRSHLLPNPVWKWLENHHLQGTVLTEIRCSRRLPSQKLNMVHLKNDGFSKAGMSRLPRFHFQVTAVKLWEAV